MTLHDRMVIVVHDMAYGPPQALRDYLIKKKADHVTFFGLPFYTQKEAALTVYTKGRVTEKHTSVRSVSEGVGAYVRDVFLILSWLGRRRSSDVYIGADVLLCFAGLVLRSVGKTKRVVLYTMDFSPVRFHNPVLDWIYHAIESICVRFSDEVWNVSPRMAAGREEFLGLPAKQYPQKHVPVGIWNDQIKKVPLAKIQRHKIVFIGHLLEKQGVQLVLEALPEVRKKIPEVEFLVIGGGPYEDTLKQKATELKVAQVVTFAGWISDPAKIFRLANDSAVAVATYKPEKERKHNFSYYGDPGKLKNYLGAGIPVVLTDISYNAKEVARRKCGILVSYNTIAVANAIIELLTDQATYTTYRRHAFAYATTMDWMHVFDTSFNLSSHA